MITEIKKYFRLEKVRNQESAAIFEKMVKHAFGAHNAVIVGHHITFEDTRGTTEENIKTENEIPSADTLIFDHDIMRECFGAENYMMVMTALAQVKVELRDKLLAKFWEMYGPDVRPVQSHQARVLSFEPSAPTPAGNYLELDAHVRAG